MEGTGSQGIPRHNLKDTTNSKANKIKSIFNKLREKENMPLNKTYPQALQDTSKFKNTKIPLDFERDMSTRDQNLLPESTSENNKLYGTVLRHSKNKTANSSLEDGQGTEGQASSEFCDENKLTQKQRHNTGSSFHSFTRNVKTMIKSLRTATKDHDNTLYVSLRENPSQLSKLFDPSPSYKRTFGVSYIDENQPKNIGNEGSARGNYYTKRGSVKQTNNKSTPVDTESFYQRYQHSFRAQPPPKGLPKELHAKWERSQMFRYRARTYDHERWKATHHCMLEQNKGKPDPVKLFSDDTLTSNAHLDREMRNDRHLTSKGFFSSKLFFQVTPALENFYKKLQNNSRANSITDLNP